MKKVCGVNDEGSTCFVNSTMKAALMGTSVAPLAGLVRTALPVVRLVVSPVVKELWKVLVICTPDAPFTPVTTTVYVVEEERGLVGANTSDNPSLESATAPAIGRPLCNNWTVPGTAAVPPQHPRRRKDCNTCSAAAALAEEKRSPGRRPALMAVCAAAKVTGDCRGSLKRTTTTPLVG